MAERLGDDAHAAQTALRAAATKASAEFASLAGQRNYVAALETMATLRPQVDAFFEQVMVMDPDAKVRAARLSLLSEIVKTFSAIGGFFGDCGGGLASSSAMGCKQNLLLHNSLLKH